MSVSIGGLTLTKSPVWIDRESSEDLETVTYKAIDSTKIIRDGDVPSERPITLEAMDKTGWIKESEIKALRNMSRIPQATYILDYNGEEFTVRFRNEQSGGAIQMSYLRDTTAPGDDTWYKGKIYLMAVA